MVNVWVGYIVISERGCAHFKIYDFVRFVPNILVNVTRFS